MAKKATPKAKTSKPATAKAGGPAKRTARKPAGTAKTAKPAKPAKTAKPAGEAKAKPQSSRSKGASDAIVQLFESPLVIDLLAVGASAALAALAEQRFSKKQTATGSSRTGRAVKAAGTAAAAAVGRRLAEEWDDLRKSSDQTKPSAKE